MRIHLQATLFRILKKCALGLKEFVFSDRHTSSAVCAASKMLTVKVDHFFLMLSKSWIQAVLSIFFSTWKHLSRSTIRRNNIFKNQFTSYGHLGNQMTIHNSETPGIKSHNSVKSCDWNNRKQSFCNLLPSMGMSRDLWALLFINWLKRR